MRFSKSDFSLMRWSTLLFFTSIIIGGIALYSSEEFTQRTSQNMRKAQNLDIDVREKLASALEDKSSMAIYADEYGMLIRNKIIGEGQRLDWIEGLESLRRQNLVANFRYQIAPQKIHTPQPPIESGNFDILYSEMKLQFDLLHEQQLVDFFTALHNQIKGNFQVKSCSLKRVNEENPALTTSVNLRAECTGGWINLKNRNLQP